MASNVLTFEADQGKLFANGKEFLVRGINWFGSEGALGAPFGLRERSVDDLMDLVRTSIQRDTTRHCEPKQSFFEHSYNFNLGQYF